MKHPSFLKTLLPHLIAAGIFTALTWAYMFPLLQGKGLAQHDIMQAAGMQKEIRDYHEKTGKWSLWTGSMFSGMPAYQIYAEYPSSLVTHVINAFKIFFPDEAHLVFLLMLCFYVLLFTFTKNPWVSVLGAIAFAFSSYNFINLDAGHTSKVRCIALMAPILAGFMAAFRGRPFFGAALTALTLAMQVRSNHFQITYYTIIAAEVISLFYLIIAIRDKQVLDFAKAAALLALASALGVGANTSQLWTTYEYSKETIRGGTSELAEERSSGLDKDYAFSWSYGKLETFTLVIPNFMGGASQDNVGGNSRLAEELRKRGMAENQVRKIVEGAPTYWGDQPFTSGPTYFGAIACFLFVLGMFIVRNPVKWAFLFLTVLCVLLSWGKNFETFNLFFFNHFPMYNKFRTPAMILTLANLCVAFVAGLALYELLSGKPDKSALLKRLKFSLVITLGILLAAGILGSFLFDFKAEADARLAESGWPLSALRADRASMLRADALRSIVLVALAGALLWGLAESKLKTNFFIAGMGVLLLFDGWQISKRYLNNDDFLTKTEIESYYRPTKANLEILKDTDLSYRVLNLTTSTFNDALTSYFHKSIGGYHAAKIRRYQDLIEKQIRANIERLSKGFTNEHIPVLNMLNMRYIIAKEDRPIRNPNAMGNAWFVPNYRAVKGAVQEMEALSDFNPAREAIVDSQFENYLQGLPQHDTAGGTLVLTAYAPDALAYKAAAAQESLAVFSEIYYDGTKGWKAYLDGTPVEHIRVNYVLRAMRVPAGEHTIEFKFEPESYYTGEKISLACSSVLLLWVAGMLVVELRKKKK